MKKKSNVRLRGSKEITGNYEDDPNGKVENKYFHGLTVFSTRYYCGKINCDNLYSFMFHEKLQDVKANRSRLPVAEIEALIGRHTEADEDCILICQGKRFASKPKL